MNYLVDTNILLWSFIDPGKLSDDVRTTLLQKDNKIFYSPVNLWEISIKFGLKKILLNGGTPEDLLEEIEKSFFLSKSISSLTSSTVYKLPMYHKDPFDRFLIWEAIQSDYILISSDDIFKQYKEEGLNLLQNL